MDSHTLIAIKKTYAPEVTLCRLRVLQHRKHRGHILKMGAHKWKLGVKGHKRYI